MVALVIVVVLKMVIAVVMVVALLVAMVVVIKNDCGRCILGGGDCGLESSGIDVGVPVMTEEWATCRLQTEFRLTLQRQNTLQSAA
ncbi:hypothetical protein ElyMa_004353900 [Elysia marginata]|uniref:Secreted protein n=1 Tax=Elysia marginata TaxID=1093978 RepID=A0AAV4H4E1_9GAST|nr:hypothetical protein ElyMa_004353900 [Elysia marginata]